jgi:hypothetical protein
MGTRRGGGRVRSQIFRRSSGGSWVKSGKVDAGPEVDGDGESEVEVDIRFCDGEEGGQGGASWLVGQVDVQDGAIVA